VQPRPQALRAFMRGSPLPRHLCNTRSDLIAPFNGLTIRGCCDLELQPADCGLGNRPVLFRSSGFSLLGALKGRPPINAATRYTKRARRRRADEVLCTQNATWLKHFVLAFPVS
jgi:hypothetical protein